MRIHLEIYEEVDGQKQMRPAAFRESEKLATAVLEWAQELANVERASFQVQFERRLRGHSLFRAKVGLRTFSIVAR